MYCGNLWTSGYYVNIVSEYVNREVIINYVKNQGQKEKDYKQLYSVQLDFDFGMGFRWYVYIYYIEIIYNMVVGG